MKSHRWENPLHTLYDCVQIFSCRLIRHFPHFLFTLTAPTPKHGEMHQHLRRFHRQHLHAAVALHLGQELSDFLENHSYLLLSRTLFWWSKGMNTSSVCFPVKVFRVVNASSSASKQHLQGAGARSSAGGVFNSKARSGCRSCDMKTSEDADLQGWRARHYRLRLQL